MDSISSLGSVHEAFTITRSTVFNLTFILYFRTEVFGYLLEVSECLPDIVNRIKEEKEFGQFGYLQKNENIEVDAIVQNIRVAYDFIIKQHGDM